MIHSSRYIYGHTVFTLLSNALLESAYMTLQRVARDKCEVALAASVATQAEIGPISHSK